MSTMYNHMLKQFPDGTQLHSLYINKVYERDIDGFPFPKTVTNKNSIERKEIDNQKRAKGEVYDLSRSNTFEWFVTLTLDGSRFDSFDYDIACKEIYKFSHWLSKHHARYILVPEQHQSGRWHFHGLIACDELKLVQAVNPYTKKDIDGIFNLVNYEGGFTTVSKIKDNKRVSSYICKYLTKDMRVPKGKKRYWASRNLERPLKAYEYIEDLESKKFEYIKNANFLKIINTKYVEEILCEFQK